MTGVAIAAPGLLFAQAPRVMTVAVLFVGDSDDGEPAARTFFEELTRLGWVEGRNVIFDRHSGKGTRQYLETLVETVVDRAPDLIFATTTSLANAVLKVSRSLPVVFTTMADPVKAGLVASLEKPGRNATGVFQLPGDASAKRFGLVKHLMPHLKRLGVVFDRATAETEQRKAAHQKAAREAGLQTEAVEFTNFEAIARIFAQFRRDAIHVVELTPSFVLFGRRREVVELAARNDIALVAHRAEWADAGAVLTYGVDIGETYRRAAGIAHRILKGARPAEIAVERPNHFELVVNPRSALALGIAIPKTLLQQAKRVVA